MPQPQALRRGSRLGVDVGSARVGVASCDPDGLLASPLATVKRGRGDMAEIARLAAERDVIEIIVGLPTRLSGTPGQAADLARDFAEALARLVKVPVRLVDERFTTVIAHAALAKGGRKEKERRTVVDQAAAALLLQSALDAERQTGRPPGEVVAATRDGG